MTDRTKQPGIQIAQIFLERASFAHREDFLTLPVPQGIPSIDFTTDFESGVSSDGRHGIVRVRARSKPEQRPLYEIDVTMTALLIVVEGQENMPLAEYVRASGPAMLYTFVRQVVADVTSRGRFGPIWLSPVNVLAVTAGVQPLPLPMPSPMQRPRPRRAHARRK